MLEFPSYKKKQQDLIPQLLMRIEMRVYLLIRDKAAQGEKPNKQTKSFKKNILISLVGKCRGLVKSLLMPI